MKTFAIVSSVRSIEDQLVPALRSLKRHFHEADLEVILVDDGASDESKAIIEKWTGRYPNSLRCIKHPGGVDSSPLNTGLAAASAEWVTFWAGKPLERNHFERIRAALRSTDCSTVAVICTDASPVSGRPEAATECVAMTPIGKLDAIVPPATACIFHRGLLEGAGIKFDGRVRPGFETTLLTLDVLIAHPDHMLAWLSGSPAIPELNALPEPSYATWANKSTYSEALVHGYLRPLENAARQLGAAPRWLQRTVLLDLRWYFAVDLRERAPTVIVNEAMAVEFHKIVRNIMRHIDIESIAALDQSARGAEIQHALLSYKDHDSHSSIALDAHDHEQGMFRLVYFVHGSRPTESIFLDDQRAEPVYQKYRACNFFRRTLLSERMLWLPIGAARDLRVRLDGIEQRVSIGRQPFRPPGDVVAAPSSALLEQARLLKRPCKGARLPLPANLRGLRARFFRWLARFPLTRKTFADAWVFIDRTDGADDNAEHMYRWVRAHHPQINSWFVVLRSTPDWKRLSKDGFRLMQPGWLTKLAVLNAEQIVSSHTDYKDGRLDYALYGDLMNFRFAFLQHGVVKDDLSHWLSNQPFDLFVSTTPAEHASFVEDDTPYTYTDREIRRTGLPRHDALLRTANATPASEVKMLVVMPTWRGSLVDDRALRRSIANLKADFADSEYAQRWRMFLGNPEIRELTQRNGQTLVFLPHPNAVPFIDAFDPPPYVQVATAKNASIQQIFCQASAFVTDYTSVAFSMAFLRKLVFYYQFDREAFYGGGHNWREGYFDYERDGFGPVALAEDHLVAHIRRYFANHMELDAEYLARMERAIPERDSRSCERTFQSILDVRQPLARSRST